MLKPSPRIALPFLQVPLPFSAAAASQRNALCSRGTHIDLSQFIFSPLHIWDVFLAMKEREDVWESSFIDLVLKKVWMFVIWKIYERCCSYSKLYILFSLFVVDVQQPKCWYFCSHLRQQCCSKQHSYLHVVQLFFMNIAPDWLLHYDFLKN